MTYDKIPYVNRGVKSSVRTSTIQPAAPKLSKVHFISTQKRGRWQQHDLVSHCNWWHWMRHVRNRTMATSALTTELQEAIMVLDFDTSKLWREILRNCKYYQEFLSCPSQSKECIKWECIVSVSCFPSLWYFAVININVPRTGIWSVTICQGLGQ